MYDRTCVECAAPFVAQKWNGKYCTPLCHSRAHERRRPARGTNHRGRVTKRCDWCGKDFTSRRSNNTACCSRTCTRRHLSYNDQSSPLPWSDCDWCGHRFIKRNGRKYCSQHCLDMNHPYRAKSSPISYGRCIEDGVLFIRRVGQLGRYCSHACRHRASKRTRRHRLRTNGQAESFTLLQVATRDGWRCHLCGERVSKVQVVPHPRAPTMDHLVPAAKGGAHALANVSLAHHECNWRKADRATAHGEQLRLIG